MLGSKTQQISAHPLKTQIIKVNMFFETPCMNGSVSVVMFQCCVTIANKRVSETVCDVLMNFGRLTDLTDDRVLPNDAVEFTRCSPLNHEVVRSALFDHQGTYFTSRYNQHNDHTPVITVHYLINVTEIASASV